MQTGGYSRSLKNGTIRKLGYGFVFAFHSNYDRIFCRFDTIHERDVHPAEHSTTARAELTASSLGCSRAAKSAKESRNLSITLYFVACYVMAECSHKRSKVKEIIVLIKARSFLDELNLEHLTS